MSRTAEPARGFRRWFRLGGENDPTPDHVGPKGMDRGRRIGITLAAVLYRMRVHGMANVPADGALLVVVNHQNFLDGALAFGELTRRSSFLIKAEAVKGPLGWLLTNVGQYALVRGVPDREPLMKALAQLKAGGVVGIFPEGTRGDGNVDTVFPGAGWLAARSGAQVLPVAIRGTARPAGARRRIKPRVDMLVGTPFSVPQGAGRAAVAAATEEVRVRLAGLVRTLDGQLAQHEGAAAPSGRKQER
ncbi:1-acyl-sn-glycerol-3-phosphate acyltransferase [Nakamurella flava]|uniref:1-acyl-sn-glycerol-3-phosphate acyltransferase n=1 Tax=Nakamurella flava TaxID=2576308 RepID=A0A4V6CSS7_9ACTN|nr:lysophospholipid acyltransferase family protein [Nakamurella flava]TKV56165.1 1-acyl-sn-glycerol-3-phosphate acyltransferase [Nakamurella flava]